MGKTTPCGTGNLGHPDSFPPFVCGGSSSWLGHSGRRAILGAVSTDGALPAGHAYF